MDLPPVPRSAAMNLIYAHSYRTAHAFAIHHDFAAGDWKWIQDADVVRHNPRADVFKVERWEANPQRVKIDLALQRARESQRLGTVMEVNEAHMGVGLGH
jgi:hypothetical protein